MSDRLLNQSGKKGIPMHPTGTVNGNGQPRSGLVVAWASIGGLIGTIIAGGVILDNAAYERGRLDQRVELLEARGSLAAQENAREIAAIKRDIATIADLVRELRARWTGRTSYKAPTEQVQRSR